jgi:hypothetical protein
MLEPVMMVRYPLFISVRNHEFSGIEGSGTKSATTAIQKNPTYCISLPHKEI